MQQLVEKYADQDFVIFAFPCNQYGKQEPGPPEDILKFVSQYIDEKYLGTNFFLFDKIDVKGKTAAPLFQYLCDKKRGILGTKSIRWNFAKFLINRNGVPVKRSIPTVEPLSLVKDIDRLLAEKCTITDFS